MATINRHEGIKGMMVGDALRSISPWCKSVSVSFSSPNGSKVVVTGSPEAVLEELEGIGHAGATMWEVRRSALYADGRRGRIYV